MRNLYERLPYNSEVNYDIEEIPKEARAWDIHTYMLANILDAAVFLDWHFIVANAKHPPKPPKPFKRPVLRKKVIEKKPKGYWPGRTIIDKGVNND